MPTRNCKKCATPIPSSAVLGGKRIALTARRFCLVCSPYGRNNRRDLTSHDDESKHCSDCKERKPLAEFYMRPGDRKNQPASLCKICQNQRVIGRQRERKQRCVEYKGGKCELCGYNKCIAALVFHHKEAKDKEFGIAEMKRAFNDATKQELDKCALLCSNCHAETHFIA